MTQIFKEEQIDYESQIRDLERKKKIADLERQIEIVKNPPDRVNTDASLDFSGTAKMIGGTLHEPKSYDAKLMHSHLEKVFLPDIMVTSAIPFVMTKDQQFLEKDSKKAEEELVQLERERQLDRVASRNQEEAMLQAIYELPEMLQNWPVEEEKLEFEKQIAAIQSDYELMKQYSFATAILESRVLTEDDILAWDVMTPFCESLPEKFLLGTMGVEGKRAEHAVKNIGSILMQQKELAEAGAAQNIFKRGVGKIKSVFGGES